MWLPFDSNRITLLGPEPEVLEGDVVEGHVEEGMFFDGINDFVLVLDSAVLPNPLVAFSVDAWVNPYSYSSSSTIISNAEEQGWALRVAYGELLAELHLTSGKVSLLTDFLPRNEFSLVALTYDGKMVRLYLDCELVGEKAGSGAVVMSGGTNARLLIGNEPQGLSQPGEAFHGVIDELEVFSRALDQSEVTALFAAGKAGKCKEETGACITAPEGLVSWLSFDQFQITQVGPEPEKVNATLVGAMVSEGMYFNGSNSFVVYPHGDVLPQPIMSFSFDAWIMPFSHKANGTIISNTEYDGWAVRISNGKLRSDLRLEGGSVQFEAGSIPLNEFSLIALTYDGDSVRLYINAVQVGVQAGSGRVKSELNWENSLMVGNEPSGSVAQTNVVDFEFHGIIDEVEVFSRALSQGEIQGLYDAGEYGKCKDPLSTIEPSASPASIENTMHVYPNPAKETLHLLIPPSAGKTKLFVVITNSAGKVVQTAEGYNQDIAQFDLKTMEAGYYFISVSTENGRSLNATFVVE